MMRKLAVLLLLVFLGGCAGVPRTPAGGGDRAAWQVRREALLGLTQWTMQARAGAGGLFGWSGSLHWEQRGEHFDIRVPGPLGVGGLQVVGTPGHLLIHKGGETYVTSHPDEFFRDRLRLTFPVSGLRYWALGVPEPGLPAQVAVDAQGRVTLLRQAGWTLEYEEYRQVGDYQLPVRFSGTRKDTRIKLAVQHWSGVH